MEPKKYVSFIESWKNGCNFLYPGSRFP